MKSFSALYYIKHNKGRAAVMIFMLFFTTLMFIAGNYVDSLNWYWEKAKDYNDKICMVGLQSSDEDYKDYNEFLSQVKNDEKLICLERTAKGFSGMDWKCTLGWEMGSVNFLFNSPEDLKTAFDCLGIECDFSDIKDNSMVISSAFAKNLGIKKGDVIDMRKVSDMEGSFTVDAIIEDDSFINFYVYEDSNSLGRVYIMSDEMEGDELYDYVSGIIGDKKVQLTKRMRNALDSQLAPVFFIFAAANILLSIILAVTANSVITGQYIKRNYEFAVYRAIGIKKSRIRRKCAAEILLMDFIAIIIGVAFTFITEFVLNELYLKPNGMYLPYVSKTAVLNFLISNLLVVLPMVLFKGRQMVRNDITEF
ncbi:MAG: ABC transporter permease [Lachnospiraceae bacterium]|nr:ABC transporter permease [Lachnospiraceae bacterium]